MWSAHALLALISTMQGVFVLSLKVYIIDQDKHAKAVDTSQSDIFHLF